MAQNQKIHWDFIAVLVAIFGAGGYGLSHPSQIADFVAAHPAFSLALPGIVIGGLVFGAIASMVADNRGVRPGLWFLAGFLFGPLGLIMAFFTGVRCPHCASMISARATICPKCRESVCSEVLA